MKKFVATAVVGFFVVACLFSASVAGAATTKDAKAMVDKAVAYYKANGKTKTIEEVKNPNGQFKKGDLFVYIFDLNGICLANPVMPKLIGAPLKGSKDADGKLFGDEMVRMAKTKGSGWVDYKYLNPETRKIEPKTTYFVRSGDMILCAGAYK